MNSLKTVLFPATVIHSIRQYPIFLLLPQINIIAPVESHDVDPAEESTDSFINSGLCQVDTPCPLGDNLSRFLHLVKDISTRKDDYAAQLSSLTLASMSASTNSGEESERAIINEFLIPKDLTAEKEKQDREAKLWQARLVLSIGEILDREEEEIARNLSMVDDSTSGLFNALKGELDEFDQDSPFAELSQLTSNFNAVHSGNIGKRLSSWTQLFTESSLKDANLFITTARDAVDILSEAYDKEMSLPPAEYSGLTLPGLIGWTEQEAIGTIHAFKENNGNIVNKICDLLSTATGSSALDTATWENITTDWKAQLEQDFPEGKWGRLPVTLYIFQNYDIQTLLGTKTAEASTTSTAVLLVG